MRHENGTPAEDYRRRLRAASYTIPMVVVLGVIVGVFGLAAWEIAKLHDRHKQPWSR